MVEIDLTLLADARRLCHGANVHRILTLIYCYQEAIRSEHEGRPYREGFEKSLREFVSRALACERARLRASSGSVSKVLVEIPSWNGRGVSD